MLGLFEKIQDLMKNLQCEPEKFNDKCTTTSHGAKKGIQKGCEYNSKTMVDYSSKFPRGRWSFLGPGSQKEMVRKLL